MEQSHWRAASRRATLARLQTHLNTGLSLACPTADRHARLADSGPTDIQARSRPWFRLRRALPGRPGASAAASRYLEPGRPGSRNRLAGPADLGRHAGAGIRCYAAAHASPVPGPTGTRTCDSLPGGDCQPAGDQTATSAPEQPARRTRRIRRAPAPTASRSATRTATARSRTARPRAPAATRRHLHRLPASRRP